MKKTLTFLLIMLAFGSLSAQTFKAVTSTSSTAPIGYTKAAVDTLVANSITRAIKSIGDANSKQDALIKVLRDSIKLVESKAAAAVTKVQALPVIDSATFKTIVDINAILSVINQKIATNKSIADTTIKSLADAISLLPGRIKVLEENKSPTGKDWLEYKTYVDKIFLWLSGVPVKP
jgi:hypothetical protein